MVNFRGILFVNRIFESVVYNIWILLYLERDQFLYVKHGIYGFIKCSIKPKHIRRKK